MLSTLISLAFIQVARASRSLTTYAGTKVDFTGDGGLGADAYIKSPVGVWGNTQGDMFIAESTSNKIRKVLGTSKLTSTFIGTGVSGVGQTSAPATSTTLSSVAGIFGDTAGDVYYSEKGTANRVRKYDSISGLVSTYSGGSGLNVADGISATSVYLSNPLGLWGDSNNNYLYICDVGMNHIRKVSINAGTIWRFAGGGGAVTTNTPATSLALNTPSGVWGDLAGNIYISNCYHARLHRVNPSGVSTVLAGNGGYGTGDGAVGTSTALPHTHLMWGDTANVYFSVLSNAAVKKVTLSSTIVTTVMGNYITGYTGDGGDAGAASIATNPQGVFADTAGVLYVADQGNDAVRARATDGIISTFMGRSTTEPGDGGPALRAHFAQPYGMHVSLSGRLYVAEYSQHKIRSIEPNGGLINAAAGVGVGGLHATTGNVRATSAFLNYPLSVYCDSADNLFIGELSNYQVRKIDALTTVISVCVNVPNQFSFLGDGGPATSAYISRVYGITGDSAGNIYFCDADYHRIRKVTNSNQMITTVVGSGTPGYYNDNGPATGSTLYNPRGVWLSSAADRLFVADYNNLRIRMVILSTGFITTVAGNGASGVYVDGVATSSGIYYPLEISGDRTDGLLVTLPSSCVVKRLSFTTGIITTVAGTTGSCITRDHADATLAALNGPHGIAVDIAGNVFVGETSGKVIRIMASDQSPTVAPSVRPSSQPTCAPSTQPSGQPSTQPTSEPSMQPSFSPSAQPSHCPTSCPSVQPSSRPSLQSLSCPSAQPSIGPSSQPSGAPSGQPSMQPLATPTVRPSSQSSVLPSGQPSASPSSQPSSVPTLQPSERPSVAPSSQPTAVPTIQPSEQPASTPTSQPSGIPSSVPSGGPSSTPSAQPSVRPTDRPTSQPSGTPSSPPSGQPTGRPSETPTAQPTSKPSVEPTSQPSSLPTEQPSSLPTVQPSGQPSDAPSSQPSVAPSAMPSAQPSAQPSVIPTAWASGAPSSLPSAQPSSQPIAVPSSIPSSQPSSWPSHQPLGQPTAQPSASPTFLSRGGFPTTSGLSVRGLNGTAIRVVLPFLLSGSTVSGDGFSDVVVNSTLTHGKAYVVHGTSNGQSPLLLQTLQSSDGHWLAPAVSYDFSGRSVANAGDINGDGYDDLIIGVPYAARVYVLFGGHGGFVDLHVGFTVFGVNSNDLTGWSVSSAGDVNGDGFTDIVIGGPQATVDGRFAAGAAYVLFGKLNSYSNIELSALSSEQGFAVQGAQAQDYVGMSVSGAGDVNGDGHDDIVVGALRMNALFAGAAYVVFGGPANSRAGSVGVESLTPTQGFSMTGAPWAQVGFSVSGAGDVNNDTVADVLVGSVPQRGQVYGTQTAYMVYGRRNVASAVSLKDLKPPEGVVLLGGGVVVMGAGDANSNGVFDMLIGGDYGFPSGVGYVILTDYLSARIGPPTALPSTIHPTAIPTVTPTRRPTVIPTVNPTVRPTAPTSQPSVAATGPTSVPSATPTSPTSKPTATPTAPTMVPTFSPTGAPSERPTYLRTTTPTALPSVAQAATPTVVPSAIPTRSPSGRPSVVPTVLHSPVPTHTVTVKPIMRATFYPTVLPPRTIAPTAVVYTHVVVVSDGGKVNRTVGQNTHFILNSTEAVEIRGEGGVGLFTVVPTPQALAVVQNFHLAWDVIDITAFTHILGLSDLNITRGSAVVNLARNQTVRLSNIQPEDLTMDHFRFHVPVPTKQYSYWKLGYTSKMIIGAVGSLVFLSWLLFKVYRHRHYFVKDAGLDERLRMLLDRSRLTVEEKYWCADFRSFEGSESDGEEDGASSSGCGSSSARDSSVVESKCSETNSVSNNKPAASNGPRSRFVSFDESSMGSVSADNEDKDEDEDNGDNNSGCESVLTVELRCEQQVDASERGRVRGFSEVSHEDSIVDSCASVSSGGDSRHGDDVSAAKMSQSQALGGPSTQGGVSAVTAESSSGAPASPRLLLRSRSKLNYSRKEDRGPAPSLPVVQADTRAEVGLRTPASSEQHVMRDTGGQVSSRARHGNGVKGVATRGLTACAKANRAAGHVCRSSSDGSDSDDGQMSTSDHSSSSSSSSSSAGAASSDGE